MTVIYGESLSTLESTIGACSIRVHKGIRRSHIKISDLPNYPQFLPLRILAERFIETGPCGASCASCSAFENKKCYGCPATEFYVGLL